MDEWEAKYKALASGIDDPKLIENAEKLVKGALSISQGSGLSLEEVLDEIIKGIRPAPRPQLFGFSVEVGDWLPANKGVIIGDFGAIVVDLLTGKCKVASKEDLEKALRNITEGS